MPKYSVYGIVTASKYLGEFEAESEDEAKEMASESDNNHICLCHQCSSELEVDDFSFHEFEVEETQ